MDSLQGTARTWALRVGLRPAPKVCYDWFSSVKGGSTSIMKRQSLFGKGAIGSYSSLFAFLLVASVSAYRNIFDLVF